MTTDRELLELAAKAAGIVGKYGQASDDYYYRGNTHGIITTLPNGNDYVWNPLDDDGDALRLDVDVELVLAPKKSRNYVMAGRGDQSSHYEHDMADQYAATRRAIVRAAAEIGKAMP